MKYYVSPTPGPMPPPPELFEAGMTWIDGKLEDGTFDCVYGFIDGGGFSVANVDSHKEVLELMADYPLYGFMSWEVKPLFAFREGTDVVMAKLREAQAAMGGS